MTDRGEDGRAVRASHAALAARTARTARGIASAGDAPRNSRHQPYGPEIDPCEHCGATALSWRKCKLICLNCGNINRSCADL